jgi:uncharacterized membrane protein
MTTTTTARMPAPARAVGAASCGLPPEQVHEWLEHVQDDLRRVRARLEFLRAEQARLENQQHLLAELLAASSV